MIVFIKIESKKDENWEGERGLTWFAKLDSGGEWRPGSSDLMPPFHLWSGHRGGTRNRRLCIV